MIITIFCGSPLYQLTYAYKWGIDYDDEGYEQFVECLLIAILRVTFFKFF